MRSLAILALGFGAAANILPALQLGRRATYAGGGWGLSTTSSDQSGCPSGTTWLDAHGWSNIDVCCPNGFTQQDYGDSNAELVCCPNGSACLDALEAEPFCADSTWVLWNATMQTSATVGWFCCLPDQIGTQNFECDSGASNVAATLSAANIGKPIPTGAAGVTISVSAGLSGSSSVTSAPGAATTTTKKGGLGGVVSSALSGITGKSDASKVLARGGNIVDAVFPGRSFIAVLLGFLAL